MWASAGGGISSGVATRKDGRVFAARGSGETVSAPYPGLVRPGSISADRDAQRIAKCADRYAVQLVSSSGQRRHRSGRDRFSVARGGRSLALAPSDPCSNDRQAGRRRSKRHRFRCRLQFAVKPGFRPSLCRRAPKGGWIGRPRLVQAIGGERRTWNDTACESSAAAIQHTCVVGDCKRRRRDGRSGSSLSVRGYVGRKVSAISGRAVGGPI